MTRNVRYGLNALPALVALFLVIALPYLERSLFPVVKDFVVVGMLKEPQAITINGYLRKVRDCTFVGVQAVAVNSAGHEHDVPIIFLDAKNNNANRPQGTQGWGPWRITVHVSDADYIKLSATHRCHWVYANDTHLANIPLREY